MEGRMEHGKRDNGETKKYTAIQGSPEVGQTMKRLFASVKIEKGVRQSKSSRMHISMVVK